MDMNLQELIEKFSAAVGIENIPVVEINYHGMKPANIDELAEKAVLAREIE